MAEAPTTNDFAGEVAAIAGRPANPEALGFLALATHLGHATAAEAGKTVTRDAHWDALVGALSLSPTPVCRWLAWGLPLDEATRMPWLQAHFLPASPQARVAALAAAREGPTPPGSAGWFTTSARTQIERAGSLAPSGSPLGVEHLAVSLLIQPAPGHDARLPALGPATNLPERATRWMADRAAEFAPGQRAVPATDGPAMSRGDMPGIVLRRMKSGAFSNIGTTLPLLAALAEETGSAPASTENTLAWLVGRAFAAGQETRTDPMRGANALIERADALARRLGGTATDLLHLLGAALAPEQRDLPPLSVGPMEPIQGPSLRDRRTRFLDLLSGIESDPGRLAAWTEVMLGGRQARVAVASDNAPAQDLLDFERHARAIAAVIADRAVTPPLAIGLFGAWGSGKSAMIGMIKASLREIEERAARGRSQDFCRGIVAVEFNAWHYAESSLWASLLVRILEELAQYLTPRAPGAPGAEERARLLIALDAALRAQQAAEAKVLASRAAAAEADRAAALALLAAQEAERFAAARAAEAAIQREAAKTTADKVADTARSLRAQAEDTLAVMQVLAGGDLRAVAGDAGGALASQMETAAKAIGDVARQAGGIRSQLRQAWRTLAEGRRVAAIALFVVALVLTLLLGWAANAGAFAWLAALVTGAVSGAAPMLQHWQRFRACLADAQRLAAVAAEAAAKAQALDAARTVAAEEARRADTSSQEARDAAAKAQAARELAMRATAEGQHAETASIGAETARQAVAEVQARIAALAPSRLLESFVGDRAASSDYTRHLGLPTLIRRDIEGLRAHLAGLRDQSPPPPRPVERIVLFIDDLDRCPRSVVVKVLEAVHILLTSDLFDVVVGVDVRWLQAALARHHERQFGGDAPIDALEYLEKIFQVPFWVPAMGPGGRAAVLSAALPAAVAAASETGPATVAAGPAPAPEVAPDGTTMEKRPVAPLPPLDPVLLREEERAALLRHGRLAGDTPRRLKRFARSYLILRASMTEEERDAYIAEAGWEDVTWLLAAGCAAPMQWNALVEAYRAAVRGEVGWSSATLFAGQAEARQRLEAAMGHNTSWPIPREAALVWLPSVARFGFSAPDVALPA